MPAAACRLHPHPAGLLVDHGVAAAHSHGRNKTPASREWMLRMPAVGDHGTRHGTLTETDPGRWPRRPPVCPAAPVGGEQLLAAARLTAGSHRRSEEVLRVGMDPALPGGGGHGPSRGEIREDARAAPPAPADPPAPRGRPRSPPPAPPGLQLAVALQPGTANDEAAPASWRAGWTAGPANAWARTAGAACGSAAPPAARAALLAVHSGNGRGNPVPQLQRQGLGLAIRHPNRVVHQQQRRIGEPRAPAPAVGRATVPSPAPSSLHAPGLPTRRTVPWRGWRGARRGPPGASGCAAGP